MKGGGQGVQSWNKSGSWFGAYLPISKVTPIFNTLPANVQQGEEKEKDKDQGAVHLFGSDLITFTCWAKDRDGI
jgi:hypothetical protein